MAKALGWTPQRVAKLRAEQRLPRYTTDVTHMSDFDAAQLLSQDILEDIDCTRVTYADRLTPSTHLAATLRTAFSPT